MLICLDCGAIFEQARIVFERHGLDTPPYEELLVCPRCEAELNPAFKQIIPYIILANADGRIFTTLRLGGDERLRGQHSIGLGGHMDGGEDIPTALYRELKEEVGLTEADIESAKLCGYVYSGKTEVDSVHVGVIYLLTISRSDVTCQERDKLSGCWCSAAE